VAIAPDLAKGLAPADTVFIFARAAEGPRMPLAMLTRQVKDLPMEFVLDDASSMIAGRKLSDAQRVVLVARVSRTGAAEPQPGDVEGTSAPVAIGTHGVHLRIDTTVR
jgi:cytochrome c-type biogenesis protein CcmH